MAATARASYSGSERWRDAGSRLLDKGPTHPGTASDDVVAMMLFVVPPEYTRASAFSILRRACTVKGDN